MDEENKIIKAFQLLIDKIGEEGIKAQVSEVIEKLLTIDKNNFSRNERREISIFIGVLNELKLMNFINEVHKEKLLETISYRYDSFSSLVIDLRDNQFLKVFEEYYDV